MGVVGHIRHGPLLEGRIFTVPAGVSLGIAPDHFRVPVLRESLPQGHRGHERIDHAVILFHITLVIELDVGQGTFVNGFLAGGYGIGPACQFLFGRLGGEQLASLVVHQGGFLFVAVEQRAGGIDGDLGFQGLADRFGDVPVMVGRFRKQGEVVVGLVQQFEDIIEAVVDVLAVHAHRLHVGVDGQAFTDDGNRSPFADQIEVVIGLQEGGFGLPLLFFGTGHVRYAVHVLHQDVTAADAPVHVCPVVGIDVGGALVSAGYLEVGVGYAGGGVGNDPAHQVPQLISGEHGRVVDDVTFDGHIGVARAQIPLGGGSEVESHVQRGDTIVRHHVEEFIAASC